MKYLLILIVLLVVSCYTGVPDMGTIYSPNNPSPGIKKGEVITHDKMS